MVGDVIAQGRRGCASAPRAVRRSRATSSSKIAGGRRATELPKLELAEEGVVEGVVVDSKGDPVAGGARREGRGADVSPASGTPPGMAVADAKGRFHLGELPEGNVFLEAYAPDVGRTRSQSMSRAVRAVPRTV